MACTERCWSLCDGGSGLPGNQNDPRDMESQATEQAWWLTGFLLSVVRGRCNAKPIREDRYSSAPDDSLHHAELSPDFPSNAVPRR